MKRSSLGTLLLAAALLTGALARPGLADTPPATPTRPPAHLVGRVVLVPGVPAKSCAVVVVGTPLADRCDADGGFFIDRLPPGSWEVKVTVDGPLAGIGIPPRTIRVGALSGEVTQAGEIVVGKPGAIGGKVAYATALAASESDYDLSVVGIPELGIYAGLGVGGQFLLTGVPPGEWTVQLFLPRAFPRLVVTGQVAHVPNGGLRTGIVLGGTIATLPPGDRPTRP